MTQLCHLLCYEAILLQYQPQLTRACQNCFYQITKNNGICSTIITHEALVFIILRGTFQNTWDFGIGSFELLVVTRGITWVGHEEVGTRHILVCRSLPFHLATCVRLASGWPCGHILFINHTCLLEGPRTGRAMFTFNSSYFPWLQNSTWFHVFKWFCSMLVHTASY